MRWGREERIWLRHQGSEAAPRTSRPAHPAALVNRAQCETQQAQCDTYVFGLCKKGRTREKNKVKTTTVVSLDFSYVTKTSN